MGLVHGIKLLASVPQERRGSRALSSGTSRCWMLTAVDNVVADPLRSHKITMPAWQKAWRCGRERWCLGAGCPWAAAECVGAREAAACETLYDRVLNNCLQREYYVVYEG